MLSTFLFVAALLFFIIAAIPVACRVNLVAARLACWAGAPIAGSSLLH